MDNNNIRIGIARKSGRNESPYYQYELFNEYGVDKTITIHETAYVELEYRTDFCYEIDNLPYNCTAVFSDLSRITRLGYYELMKICGLLWTKNIKIFVILGEMMQDFYIDKETNEITLYTEAEKATKQAYLRSLQTEKGIAMAEKLTEKKKSKPNSGLPLEQKKIEQIIELYHQKVSKSEIARTLDVCRPSVIKHIKRHGKCDECP